MSIFPENPIFPEPYASTGIANPAQNAANTLEQRSIGSMSGPAYPPESAFEISFALFSTLPIDP